MLRSKKARAFSYGGDAIQEVEALCQTYLLLEEVKVNSFGDWSNGARKSLIFDAALEKCRRLFPSTSGSFFSPKATRPKYNDKKKRDDKEEEEKDKEASNRPTSKRKGEDNSQRVVCYEVSVPQELSVGDIFLTSVKVGDSTRKVKLTVPEGRPTTLRFKLSPATKKQKTKS